MSPIKPTGYNPNLVNELSDSESPPPIPEYNDFVFWQVPGVTIHLSDSEEKEKASVKECIDGVEKIKKA